MADPAPRTRTLTITPGGVIATILLAALVAIFVRLGFWQLDRLSERRTVNAGVAARLNAPPIDDVAALTDTTGLFYRTITASGAYDNARSIILPGRSHRGMPGVYLLTPLRLHGRNDAVLVNRGWVPSADAATIPLDKLELTGPITVSGLVLPFPGVGQSLAPRALPHADSGFQRTWYSVDDVALRAQFPYPLLPATVQELPNARAGYPVRLDPPMIEEGPHLGYALQWFSFALIGVIGWIALVMRRRTSPARVAPPAAVAMLFVLMPCHVHAQLRPLDPMEWQVYEPGTFLIGTAGIGSLWEQPASRAGTRGRLLELGNYRISFRFDRMAVELGGTALWRLTDEIVEQAPAGEVQPPNGLPRQDVGLASAATLVDLTPPGSPIDVVFRFGARIPTTSDETGLDRDRTDFFAVAALRYRTGPFSITAENGVGIHGTVVQDYPQSDVWAYAFGAEYRRRMFFGSAHMVGHEDGHDWAVRGNEDLSELRFGAGFGDRYWIGATYIRGLSDFSPRHGFRIGGGVRVDPFF